MLAAVSATAGFVGPSLRVHSVPARSAACVMEEAPSALVLKQLNTAFWKSKKAMLEAELDQKLRDLEEYETREQALFDTLSGPALAAAPAPAGALGAAGAASADLMQQMSTLMAELTAEKERSAALEAELENVLAQKEIDLQKTSAFWIEQLAAAKGGAAPAPADAAAPAATADIAPESTEPLVEEGLTVHELRARLLAYGLSTTGLKAELRTRPSRSETTHAALALLDDPAPSARVVPPGARAAPARRPSGSEACGGPSSPPRAFPECGRCGSLSPKQAARGRHAPLPHAAQDVGLGEDAVGLSGGRAARLIRARAVSRREGRGARGHGRERVAPARPPCWGAASAADSAADGARRGRRVAPRCVCAGRVV